MNVEKLLHPVKVNVRCRCANSPVNLTFFYANKKMFLNSFWALNTKVFEKKGLKVMFLAIFEKL